MSSAACVFGFDRPKSAEEHYKDFCGIGGAKLVYADQGRLAIECGVQSGIVVIQIGTNRGSFVPKLKAGKYGVEHTSLGNLVTKTKRLIDVNRGTTSLIFGIVPGQWLDGLNSCTLVQPDLEGRGAINLLGDDSVPHPIEPTEGFSFYTPFYHIPGAGSSFTEGRAGAIATTYPLYRLGIMTLDRTQLSELLRAFNNDWSNGPVFARKNKIGEQSTDVEPSKKKGHGRRSKKKKEGLEK